MGRSTVFHTLACAGLCLAVLAGCGGHDEPGGDIETSADRPARTVTVALVERRPLEGGVVASGELVSREEAAVSAEISGFRVARVLADVGDQVGAGQVLVQLDDTLLRSQIAQQRALAEQAEVAARQATAQAERVSGLEGTGAVAGEQIEQRRFQAESAAAAAAAQRAALQDLETRAGKMAVRTPVGGVVLERSVRPGELSGSGAPMFRIVRDNLVELSANVPESSLRSIQRGAPAMVSLPNGQVVQGRVRVIEPLIDETTGLGQVRIALPVRADLRPGGSATAEFTDLRADVASVPETAVNYDADGVSVFVVNSENRVERVGVRTGRRGGGYVELIEGPPVGARVLVNAGSFVLEGDLVRVANDAPATRSAETEAQ